MVKEDTTITIERGVKQKMKKLTKGSTLSLSKVAENAYRSLLEEKGMSVDKEVDPNMIECENCPASVPESHIEEESECPNCGEVMEQG